MKTIDWSELHDDLIGEIAKNIGIAEDFISFSRVCPSWRSAAVKENWVAAGTHQLPWLALVEKEDDQQVPKENRRGFFNFKTNKRYELELPQLGPTRSFGCSLGWIVTLNMNLEVHMINPLSRVKLRLPHLFTLKHMPRHWVLPSLDPKQPDDVDPHDDSVQPRYLMTHYINKAFVFTRNQQLCVAVIYGDCTYFAMARPGDESWTEVECEYEMNIGDAAYVNGQLLLLHFGGGIGVCEFDWIQSPKLLTLVSIYTYTHIAYSHKAYLVESMGDLLMVVRCLFNDNNEGESLDKYMTNQFDIYKLDVEKKVWMELSNLGDMTLFLGNSYSLSLCSTGLNCEGNAIYYTDDNYEQWDMPDSYDDGLYIADEYGGHDIGIFSLNDKTFRPLNHNLASDDLRSTYSCPFWMIPSLFLTKRSW